MSLDLENKRILKAIGNRRGWIWVVDGRTIVNPFGNHAIRQNIYMPSDAGNPWAIQNNPKALNLTVRYKAMLFERTSGKGGSIRQVGGEELTPEDQSVVRCSLRRITSKQVEFLTHDEIRSLSSSLRLRNLGSGPRNT